MVNVAVIYYSATGGVHALASAVAEGAVAAGADVRLRKVRELAPPEAIARNPKWVAHADATKHLPEASLDDLEWADAAIFGSPTRFSNVTAQLKQYIDQTGGLWMQGKLVDKVVSGFTSASTRHGGHESTLIALYNTFYNWGCIIVPPGYADPIQYKAGTPFGATFDSGGGAIPDEVDLASARFQGKRVAEIAAALKAGKQALGPRKKHRPTEAAPVTQGEVNMPVPVTRLNHAVLYVRNLDTAVNFYKEAFGFEEIGREGGRMAFLRAQGGSNHHDLGLMAVGEHAPAPPKGSVGLYHLAWQVTHIEDLAEMEVLLANMGALGGRSDHGATKSLYGKDPDGNEFEVMWLVPREEWGEYDRRGVVMPLDMEKEVARFGSR